MTFADDPHLIERLARLAEFHELPEPVIVQLAMMASELQRQPAPAVYEQITRSKRAPRPQQPRLRVVG